LSSRVLTRSSERSFSDARTTAKKTSRSQASKPAVRCCPRCKRSTRTNCISPRSLFYEEVLHEVHRGILPPDGLEEPRSLTTPVQRWGQSKRPKTPASADPKNGERVREQVKRAMSKSSTAEFVTTMLESNHGGADTLRWKPWNMMASPSSAVFQVSRIYL